MTKSITTFFNLVLKVGLYNRAFYLKKKKKTQEMNKIFINGCTNLNFLSVNGACLSKTISKAYNTAKN